MITKADILQFKEVDYILLDEIRTQLCDKCSRTKKCPDPYFCRYLVTAALDKEADLDNVIDVIKRLAGILEKTSKSQVLNKQSKIRKKVCKKCLVCVSEMVAASNLECVNNLYDQLASLTTTPTWDDTYYYNGMVMGSCGWNNYWDAYEDKDDEPLHTGTLQVTEILDGDSS